MRKIIIIPAYNESESIKDTIEQIHSKALGYDYIVINDNSKDSTKEILERNQFTYLDLPTNLGIGGAVQTGYRYALQNGYDIAVQIDGDGQHDVEYLERMERALQDNDADMVIGSRFIRKEGFQSSWLRRVGIVYFSGLIKLLTGKQITDPTSGMRIVNRSIMELFAFCYPRDYPEPESVVYLLRNKKKITEVPVVMKERQGGVSSIRFGRSVYYMIKVTLAILIERIR